MIFISHTGSPAGIAWDGLFSPVWISPEIIRLERRPSSTLHSGGRQSPLTGVLYFADTAQPTASAEPQRQEARDLPQVSMDDFAGNPEEEKNHWGPNKCPTPAEPENQTGWKLEMRDRYGSEMQ